DGEVLRDVAEIRIHPDFGRPHAFSHDISLLRLSEPVNFTDHIHPICVPKVLEKITPKSKGFVTGWGATSEGGEISNKLRQVLVPFLNQKECECEYEGEIDDTMVCAGRKGIDSCQGDSGGPLVTKHKDTQTWYQAGIVSWGQGCGERGHAGKFM
ncbi:trypsin, partial [Oesophagostomum dentatum]